MPIVVPFFLIDHSETSTLVTSTVNNEGPGKSEIFVHLDKSGL